MKFILSSRLRLEQIRSILPRIRTSMAAHSVRACSLCLFVLAVGCWREAPQAVHKVAIEGKVVPKAVEKVEAVEEKPTPQAPVTEDDFEIFDVVLVDLPDFENAWYSSPTRIILDPTTVGGPGELCSEAQFNNEANPDKGWTVSVELQEDLRRRNPVKPIPLAGYQSPSPKILVKDLVSSIPNPEQWDRGDANAFRFRIRGLLDDCPFIIAWLPGYSKDGRTAVFRASLEPSAHGATLTYKLAKKDGKWTVVWRYVARYK